MTRWRKMWEREWTDYDDDGAAVVLNGTAMETVVSLGWGDIESAAEDRDRIERAALRIRAGARHACARLRRERDEAILRLASAQRAHDAARESIEALRTAVSVELSRNGCDCDCEHHQDEHGPECTRCFACRIEAALRAIEVKSG